LQENSSASEERCQKLQQEVEKMMQEETHLRRTLEIQLKEQKEKGNREKEALENSLHHLEQENVLLENRLNAQEAMNPPEQVNELLQRLRQSEEELGETRQASSKDEDELREAREALAYDEEVIGNWEGTLSNYIVD
jgi:chromosome segregation ATPase